MSHQRRPAAKLSRRKRLLSDSVGIQNALVVRVETFGECKAVFDRVHSKPMDLLTADSIYPPHTSITLRTRLNNEIDNIQSWQHSTFEWQQFGDQAGKWEKAGAVRLSEPCPVYNCHGLTFASRRTQVDGSLAMSIQQILKEDGYTEVPEPSTRFGDVIVYYDDQGRAEHSGIVVSKPNSDVLMVWSKWGKGHELIHPAGSCLWGSFFKKFYRITKWNYKEAFSESS